jgi:hypothetical protein
MQRSHTFLTGGVENVEHAGDVIDHHLPTVGRLDRRI